LAEPVDLEGAARGIAFQLSEHLGILPRALVADEVKGLDQDVRAKMRKHGVKFGAYHIYLPLSLKPAPRELALILYALKHGGVRQPGVSDLPHTVLSGRTSFEIDPEVDTRLYEVAGFKVAGKRAVRVDILERLADIIRPLIAIDPKRHQGELPAGAAEGNGFRVTVEMTSLLGCAGEDFASILSSLGYRVRRTPKPAVEATAANEGNEAQAIEAALASPDETAERESPVEETPLTGETEPVVETETADTGVTEPVVAAEAAEPGSDTAEPVAAETTDAEAAPEAAAEPQFDEVWFPAGRRPDNRRHHGPRREAGDGEARQEQQGRQGNGQRQRFDRGPRPDQQGAAAEGKQGGRPNGKGKPRRFDNNGKDKGFERPQRERRERPYDPDSPFAALAALRDRKPD
jgi:ATP-dependent RNA helicase SUPV3L1/SUV3